MEKYLKCQFSLIRKIIKKESGQERMMFCLSQVRINFSIMKSLMGWLEMKSIGVP